jgi:hypothetical protein
MPCRTTAPCGYPVVTRKAVHNSLRQKVRGECKHE